jgi:glycosyltransferase involved in cell wall biosynthesis
MEFNNQTAAFIIPYWTDDFEKSEVILGKTIEGIANQTDDNWMIILVDDASPSNHLLIYLSKLEENISSKIHVLFNTSNEGPGHSRNKGIEMAREKGISFILFNDADDISHKDRLKTVRNIFNSNNQIDVIYTTFSVIDEYGIIVGQENLSQSIQEILESHVDKQLVGNNVWIDMGTKTGYTNLTSATAVRTSLASQYPFPKEKVSEDFYAWMLYSAGGNEYYYAGEIPTLYRIPQNSGSVTRSRIKEFYSEKARVDERGFKEAIRTAHSRNPALFNFIVVKELLKNFYLKLADTLNRERQHELAQEQINKINQYESEGVDVTILREG